MAPPFDMLIWIGVALFGAIVGSFLNVCIVRIPRDESTILPRSHCQHCRHPLAWWENIPFVSVLLLRGRCRYCDRAISWRYPLVEGLTMFVSLILWWRFGDPVRYLVFFLFFAAPLIALSFIDLEHLIIPDRITLPGIAIGFLTRIFFPSFSTADAVLDAFLGVLTGGGMLFVIAWSYEKLKKKEGLGGGDVKLAAMLGAFFGWRASIFILLISSLLGLIVGIALLIFFRKGREYPIPFGPFLSLAGFFYLLVGDRAVAWYLYLLS